MDLVWGRCLSLRNMICPFLAAADTIPCFLFRADTNAGNLTGFFILLVTPSLDLSTPPFPKRTPHDPNPSVPFQPSLHTTPSRRAGPNSAFPTSTYIFNPTTLCSQQRIQAKNERAPIRRSAIDSILNSQSSHCLPQSQSSLQSGLIDPAGLPISRTTSTRAGVMRTNQVKSLWVFAVRPHGRFVFVFWLLGFEVVRSRVRGAGPRGVEGRWVRSREVRRLQQCLERVSEGMN